MDGACCSLPWPRKAQVPHLAGFLLLPEWSLPFSLLPGGGELSLCKAGVGGGQLNRCATRNQTPRCGEREHCAERVREANAPRSAATLVVVPASLGPPLRLARPPACLSREAAGSLVWLGGLWDSSPGWHPEMLFPATLIRPEPASHQASALSSGRGAVAFFPVHPRPAQRVRGFHQATVSGARPGSALPVYVHVCVEVSGETRDLPSPWFCEMSNLSSVGV